MFVTYKIRSSSFLYFFKIANSEILIDWSGWDIYWNYVQFYNFNFFQTDYEERNFLF